LNSWPGYAIITLGGNRSERGYVPFLLAWVGVIFPSLRPFLSTALPYRLSLGTGPLSRRYLGTPDIYDHERGCLEAAGRHSLLGSRPSAEESTGATV
jgi:hypothetical protein